METSEKFENSPLHDKKAILSAMDQLEAKDMVKVVELITKSLYGKSTDNSEGLIIKYEDINDFIQTTSYEINSYYGNVKYEHIKTKENYK